MTIKLLFNIDSMGRGQTFLRLDPDGFAGKAQVQQLTDYGFSPDGRYLVTTYSTGGYSGSVPIFPDSVTPERWHLVLWRVDDLSSKFFLPRIIQSQKKSFTDLAFSPDGKFLVTGGDAIRLWKMPN